MKKSKIAVANPREGKIAELATQVEHKLLATWALDCAERVLPFFEGKYPDDCRPRAAIQAGRNWVATGKFSMPVIRKASLDSHAAARAVNEDDAARSAARAAGQAVAAAHVPAHALAAAAYAATAVRDVGQSLDLEREWQYLHLLELNKTLKKN